ncbi:MAG: DUF3501 family protein [Acidimicrobiales bacterium]
MMLRNEYPDLVAEGDRAAAAELAEAVMDPGEFLWSIRKEDRFNEDFKSTPGEVAYHAPCHLRAQAVGFKGRDLIRKIPGTNPTTTMECCGHDGTYAMKTEGSRSPCGSGRRRSRGCRPRPARRCGPPIAPGGHPVRPARRPPPDAPHVGAGPGLPCRWVPHPGRSPRRGGQRAVSRLIERADIVDYQTYEDTREATRAHILEVKAPRRIHLGENLPFLFENRETLIYQVQEIMRAERIAREAAIVDEIATYNKMLGETGELGCALLIEIPDAADRKPLLQRWLGLQERLYVRFADGSRAYATFDPMQVGTDRLSAVQYLRFACPSAPVAIGTDFPELIAEVELTEEQQTALAADLAA